jgi:hypothetical protein
VLAIEAENLFDKIKTLNERLWEQRVTRPVIDSWLANFKDDWGDLPSEQLHALYLLSQFIYFGDREVRELLRALYRDHYRYPIVSALRRAASDTLDADDLRTKFLAERQRSRFLGMGNPSESGTHLLYYFRQENRLPKSLFVSLAELFDRRLDDPDVDLDDTNVRRIIFVDDLCGSGSQAIKYSSRVLEVLRRLEQRRGIELRLSYLVLVANAEALDRVRQRTHFDDVDAVLELDETHKSLSPASRHFKQAPQGIDRAFARSVCTHYGRRLWPAYPLGWDHDELLLGFHHNIPDNTLPIVWWDDESRTAWQPVLRRYPKVYG